MKKTSIRRQVRFFSLALAILSCCQLVYADKIWKGAVTADVTDENLLLDNTMGDIVLPLAGRTVTANTIDVNVTMNGNVLIKGNNTPSSQLYLCASQGRKITFNVTSNLTFNGSDDAGPTPLLIIVGGLGSVDFVLDDDQCVTFSSDAAAGNAGVELYVVMETPNGNDIPQLCFRRTNTASANNVKIGVGPDSVVGYLADDSVSASDEDGCVKFDPSNMGNGRMHLNIDDCGAVVVSGRKLLGSPAKTSITLMEIDRKLPAGHKAMMKIVNSVGNTHHAGLIVSNRNDKCFDLLFDPWCVLGARDDATDFNGTFNGIQYGFVLGNNGILDIQDLAFFDYVGLALNRCCDIGEVPGFEGMDPDMLIKTRNGSALVVDGYHDPSAIPAKIALGSRSGLFFRSGVDNEGNVNMNLADPLVFTIDPLNETPGFGNLVMVVEGELNVCGSNNADLLRSKIEILSLHVANPPSGPLFLGQPETIFPIRSFLLDGNSDPRQYNKAAFMVNNRMNLHDAALAHTDELHLVLEKNDVQTEPTYIGGDTFSLKENIERPRIRFINSRLLVHTDMAVAGMDLVVPQGTPCPDHNNLMPDCINNTTKFTFFNNGKRVDAGTGRHLNLGTQVGSTACDTCTIVSRDAHLDVQQDMNCTNTFVPTHLLQLTVANNDATINSEIMTLFLKEDGIHTIYLGHTSNISIGTNADMSPFMNDTCPEFNIAGNFFSFETHGGKASSPETSNVTGSGGMFVDLNGKATIGTPYRANMSMMVTKSRNGIVDLPKNQVFFDTRVGIAEWKLDLTDSNKRVIIPAGECLSDYTLHWINTTKDYDNFCPYVLEDVNTCTCPAVQANNIASLPKIQGTVNQLKIKD